MSSAQYVWELSRAILADHDGYVAVLKVYMDESGVHDASPAVTVGAYIAKPSAWRDFTKEWNRLKRPINVFHSVDCANLAGEFKGWDEAERDKYVARLLPVIARHKLAGVVIGIYVPAFEEAMAAVPEVRTLFGSPYDGCFQWCVQRIVGFHNRAHSKQRLAFFHEINDYQAECKRSFVEIESDPNNTSRSMSLTFGRKSDFVPLQAADVLAYEGNKRMRDINKPYIRRAFRAINPHLDRVLFQYFGEDNKDQMIRLLRRAYQKQRIAALAAQSSEKHARMPRRSRPHRAAERSP
jgi:Protein of unknown function (DUF3800)